MLIATIRRFTAGAAAFALGCIAFKNGKPMATPDDRRNVRRESIIIFLNVEELICEISIVTVVLCLVLTLWSTIF